MALAVLRQPSTRQMVKDLSRPLSCGSHPKRNMSFS